MIHIVETGELAQRPEVLAKITDGSFDLSFFPAAGGIAGVRNEAVFTGEAEKTRQKTDKPAIVLGNGGGEIIVSDFARNAAESRSSTSAEKPPPNSPWLSPRPVKSKRITPTPRSASARLMWTAALEVLSQVKQ